MGEIVIEDDSLKSKLVITNEEDARGDGNWRAKLVINSFKFKIRNFNSYHLFIWLKMKWNLKNEN